MTHPETGPRGSILVVDDDGTIRVLLQIALKRSYDVLCVPNGPEVPGLIEDRKPNLILLDINVPGSDGYALCAGVRKQASIQGLPILFMTVCRDAPGFFEDLRADGNSCIRKPFEIPKLETRIERALKRPPPS